MMRNRITIWRRYAIRFPRWVFTDMYKCAWTIIKLIFFEDMKSKKIKLILRGFYHGIIGHFENS